MNQGASRAKCNAVGPRLERGVRPHLQVVVRAPGPGGKPVLLLAVGRFLPPKWTVSCVSGLLRPARSCSSHLEIVMMQSGRIVGTVEFRPGDGPKMAVPKGRIEFETSRTDATLSWVDGETHGAATMPLTEFNRYVSDGAIRLN
jgi:hypothetical protein